MFKKSDYIIISVLLFFLGIFMVTQYKAGKEYINAIKPETNAVLAVEVSKLTKSNSDLRTQVRALTLDLDVYKNTSESKKVLYDKYAKDKEELSVINGLLPKSGQGVALKVEGRMVTAQIVDLVNAIRNIGSDLIVVNGSRLMINTDLSLFSGQNNYDILIYGNGKMLKSALERKGGIVEQISTKDMRISVEERDNIVVPTGTSMVIKYSKSINN
jgi:uncharacterized protein YlxW (UPF0749 family)